MSRFKITGKGYKFIIDTLEDLQEQIENIKQPTLTSREIAKIVDECIQKEMEGLRDAFEIKYHTRLEVLDEIKEKVEEIVKRDLSNAVQIATERIQDEVLVALARKAIGIEKQPIREDEGPMEYVD